MRGEEAWVLFSSCFLACYSCIPVATARMLDGKRKCPGQQSALSLALCGHLSTRILHHFDGGADFRLTFPSTPSLNLLRQDKWTYDLHPICESPVALELSVLSHVKIRGGLLGKGVLGIFFWPRPYFSSLHWLKSNRDEDSKMYPCR